MRDVESGEEIRLVRDVESGEEMRFMRLRMDCSCRNCFARRSRRKLDESDATLSPDDFVLSI